MLRRAIALHVVVAVRTLGATPWVCYLGHAIVARLQEPPFLRLQRTQVTWDACTIATFTICILGGVAWATQTSFSFKRNIGLVRALLLPVAALAGFALTTSVVATAVPWCLDLVGGERPPAAFLFHRVLQPILLALPALVAAPGISATRMPGAGIAAVLVSIAVLTLSLSGEADPRMGFALRPLAATLLATVGTLCLSAYLCHTRATRT